MMPDPAPLMGDSMPLLVPTDALRPVKSLRLCPWPMFLVVCGVYMRDCMPFSSSMLDN